MVSGEATFDSQRGDVDDVALRFTQEYSNTNRGRTVAALGPISTPRSAALDDAANIQVSPQIMHIPGQSRPWFVATMSAQVDAGLLTGPFKHLDRIDPALQFASSDPNTVFWSYYHSKYGDHANDLQQQLVNETDRAPAVYWELSDAGAADKTQDNIFLIGVFLGLVGGVVTTSLATAWDPHPK